jgi:hypothetical protein
VTVDRLGPDDVRTGAVYDAERSTARASATEQRRLRRIDLGERLSLVFENRDTLRAAAEELLRAERIADPERTATEVAAFNDVIPEAGRLLATLFLDVSDAADLPVLLAELEGAAETVYVDVAGMRAVSAPVTAGDADAEAERRAPAVLLTIELTPQQREAWQEGAPVTVGIDHPRYRASTALGDDQRAAIAGDLA